MGKGTFARSAIVYRKLRAKRNQSQKPCKFYHLTHSGWLNSSRFENLPSLCDISQSYPADSRWVDSRLFLFVASFAHIQLPHFAVQIAAVQAKFGSGFGHVTATSFDVPPNVIALKFLGRVGQRHFQ